MNKATVESVMALAKAYGNALGCSATDTRELKGVLRAEVERLAAQAEPAPAPKKCNRCNGTGLVSDGAIYGSGGVEYENGPVLCVKDCPDCVGPQLAPATVGEQQAKALEAGWWLPIETCPETGFFLVHKDGAIRTMFRFDGKWDHADPPVLIDQWGDSMVSNEVEKHYPGKKLGISGGILEPTHWMPLPTPPKDKS